MTPARNESKSRNDVLLLMRVAIGTAMKRPTETNTHAALMLATEYPKPLGSSELRLNLGQQRWAWLNERGVYPVYAGVTEPRVTK